MELKEYTVAGATYLLNESDARRLGAELVVKAAPAIPNKARVAPNKRPDAKKGSDPVSN